MSFGSSASLDMKAILLREWIWMVRCASISADNKRGLSAACVTVQMHAMIKYKNMSHLSLKKWFCQCRCDENAGCAQSGCFNKELLFLDCVLCCVA